VQHATFNSPPRAKLVSGDEAKKLFDEKVGICIKQVRFKTIDNDAGRCKLSGTAGTARQCCRRTQHGDVSRRRLVVARLVRLPQARLHVSDKRLHGNDASDDICWFAPSTVMNPKLPASVVDKALADDSFKAGAEYLNRWRDDLSDFIPLDAVDGATDFSIRERPPLANINSYVAYVDAAGGTGSDSFTVAIGHRETSTDRVILDVLRERAPRFVPSEVIAEYAALLRSYRTSTIQGDAFGGGLVSDEFRRHNIIFKASPHTTFGKLSARLALAAQWPRPPT
jgi:hypothetical protein